jgi:hypothetical protein
MAKLIAACLGLAVLSLLLPSEPSYDPWAWLVWGRELVQLELDTSGGPSWKPGPALFAAAVAPLAALGEDVPAALWLVVARAGALLALVLAARLAARLAGGGRPASIVAGLVAAGGLLVTPDWIRYMGHGNEPPLAVALVLWAVERHLDGRRDHALLLACLACLLRPELFAVTIVYAVFVLRQDRGRLPWVAGLLACVPLLWLVPEWIGAGHPLDAGLQARSEPTWSLSRAEVPWRRALVRMHNHTLPVLELLALVALAAAALRRRPAVLVIGGFALAQIVLFALSTELGFSGNARYALTALVAVALLAGVGAGRLTETALAPRTAPLARRALAAAALAALVLLAAPQLDRRADRIAFEWREVGKRAELMRELDRAVGAVGGRDAVGERASVNRAFHTRLAWELDVGIRAVERARGRGVVFEVPARLLTGRVRLAGRERRRVPLAQVGPWNVYRRVRFPQSHRHFVQVSAFTRRLQVFHIRARDGRNVHSRVVTR